MAAVAPGAGGIENLLVGWAGALSEFHDVHVVSVNPGSISDTQTGVMLHPFEGAHDCAEVVALVQPDLVISNNRPLIASTYPHLALFHNDVVAWRDPPYDSVRHAREACQESLSDAGAVAAVSTDLAERVAAAMGARVSVFRPFADAVFFDVGAASVEKRPVVSYVGRLLEKKGVAAVLRLAAACPDIRFEVTNFIAPWSTPTPEHRRLAAAAQKLPNVVLLDPPRDRRDLAQLVASTSVVVVPSRWREPFGLVAIEAQAAGSHVLVSGSGGLSETVPGRSSVVDFDDLEYVGGRLRDLLASPNPDPSVRTWVESQFTLPRSTARLQELMARVVGE